jgi:hypothetical protein
MQLQRGIKLIALEALHVVWIGLTECILRRDTELRPLAFAQAEQLAHETRQQTAITNAKCRRRFIESRIDDIAIFQL